jgi:hypothetical protein
LLLLQILVIDFMAAAHALLRTVVLWCHLLPLLLSGVNDGMQSLADEVAAWMGVGGVVLKGVVLEGNKGSPATVMVNQQKPRTQVWKGATVMTLTWGLCVQN